MKRYILLFECNAVSELSVSLCCDAFRSLTAFRCYLRTFEPNVGQSLTACAVSEWIGAKMNCKLLLSCCLGYDLPMLCLCLYGELPVLPVHCTRLVLLAVLLLCVEPLYHSINESLSQSSIP